MRQGNLTLEVANTAMDKAQDNDVFQLQDFEIVSQQIDKQDEEATVHYCGTVAIVRDGTEAIFAAFIEQDVALSHVGDKWLISGGDAPKITPNTPATTSPASVHSYAA